MSQQSLTFLSQSANGIFAPKKPIGGTSVLNEGIAGSMKLKCTTVDALRQIREADQAEERRQRDEREMRLSEFHYMTMIKGKQERVRLGALDLPPKPIGSIPGYSGFIPRKENTGIIGQTNKAANLESGELFAHEQEIARRQRGTILGPSSDLRTPDTSELASDPGVL